MSRLARPPSVPATLPRGLSPQQVHVWHLARRGYTVAEIAHALVSSEGCVRKELSVIAAKARSAVSVQVGCSTAHYNSTAAERAYPTDRYGRQVAPVAAMGEGVHVVSVRGGNGCRYGARSGRAKRYRMNEDEYREYLARQAEEEERRRREIELRAPLERKTLEVLQGAKVAEVCGQGVTRREFLIAAARAGVPEARPVLRQARRETIRELVAGSRGVILSASPSVAAVALRYAPPSVAAGLKSVPGGCFRADPRVACAAREALLCAELAVDPRLQAHKLEEARVSPTQPERQEERTQECAEVRSVRDVELSDEDFARILERAPRALELVWPDGSTTVVVADRVEFEAGRPGRRTRYECVAGADIVMPGDTVTVLEDGSVRVVAWGACGPPVVVAKGLAFSPDGPQDQPREELVAVRRMVQPPEGGSWRPGQWKTGTRACEG